MALSPLLTTLATDNEIVTAVAWSPDGQLLSCSDDKSIGKWSADGESVGKISIDVFVTCISWFPATGKQVCCYLSYRTIVK